MVADNEEIVNFSTEESIVPEVIPMKKWDAEPKTKPPKAYQMDNRLTDRSKSSDVLSEIKKNPRSNHSEKKSSSKSSSRKSPSDSELQMELRMQLSLVNLETTSKKQMFEKLQARYGVDLSEKRDLIYEYIDKIVQ
jgi:hypothetical protein